MDYLFEDISFTCETCGKSFSTKANLKRHTETHEERKECPCGATRSTTEGLRKHQKSCQFLTGGTSEMSGEKSDFDLRISFSSEKKELKPISLFGKPTALKPVAGPSFGKPKLFTCSVCSKGYTSKTGLSKHFEQVHPNETQTPKKMASSSTKTKQAFDHSSKTTFATTKTTSLEIGDRVSTAKLSIGTLRYIGHVNFADGKWAGIELDKPIGKHDGQGYFRCPPKHGLFTRLHRLTKLSHARQPEENAGLKRKISSEQSDQDTISSMTKKKKKLADDNSLHLKIKYEETVEKWKKAQSGKKRLEAKLLETKVSLQKVEREKASRINELMQEIGTLRGSVRNMELEKERYEKQIITLESEKSAIYNQMLEAKTEKQRMKETLEQANNKTSKELQDLRKENDMLTINNRELKTKCIDLKMETDRLKRQIELERTKSRDKTPRSDNADQRQRNEGGVTQAIIREHQQPSTIPSAGIYCARCGISNDHEDEDCPN